MKNHLLLFAALFVASSFQNEITPIWKNNKLTTVPAWGKEWRVSFEIQPVSKHPKWSNILHFTVGGDCCKSGQRIPGVWFRPGTLKLMVATSLNGNGNANYNSPLVLPLNKFTPVIVQQMQDTKGIYRYTIVINGKTVYNVVNKKPELFKNVNVYAGDPWYTAGDAVLRNFQFTVEPEFTGNIKKGRLLKTIPTWGKEWQLSFQVKPLSKSKAWTNILHMTTGKNSGPPGSRIPAIYMYPNSRRLTVFSQVGTNANLAYTTPKDLPITKYTNVKVEQLMNNQGKYYYKIIINGKLVYNVVQTKPTEFKNVKLYASDPWYAHADVYVRDLHLVGISGQHFYKTL